MDETAAQLDVDPRDDVERIVELTKQALILGRIRPRERLVEEDLCQRFDASRHTVRSAFGRLEHLGLVVRRPNKGVIVRDFEPAELDEIFDLRALLQGEAARRMTLPPSAELVARLKRIHSDQEKALETGEIVLVFALSDEFERTFFKAANNRFLTDAIDRLRTETLAIQSYGIADASQRVRSFEDHGRIIAALAASDRALLEMLVVDHVWLPLNAYKRVNAGWQTVSH
jgi:DNA-binding GntR family transcriptional regulator